MRRGRKIDENRAKIHEKSKENQPPHLIINSLRILYVLVIISFFSASFRRCSDFLFSPPIKKMLKQIEKNDRFDVTMSFISKNGSRGAGQKRIWSHGDLFRELFRFLWNLLFFKTPIWRHHELNLEKRVPGSRSKVNLEPRRPVSCFFLHSLKIINLLRKIRLYVCQHRIIKLFQIIILCWPGCWNNIIIRWGG